MRHDEAFGHGSMDHHYEKDVRLLITLDLDKTFSDDAADKIMR